MLIRLLAIASLLLAGDEKKLVDAVCPVDGHKFQAYEVTSQDYARAWGGADRDFCKHAFKTTPLEYLAWVCPSCLYAGTKAEFAPNIALTDEQKKAIAGNLKPAAEIRKGMKQDVIAGHVKFDLAAQAAILRGAPPTEVGRFYLNATWCARQQGAILIDDFDDWVEMRRDFGLEITPIDLKSKNRTELELEIAKRVEKQIDEKRVNEQRDIDIVGECDLKIAELKKSGAPAADIKAQEQRRGDARGRLHRLNLLKYTTLFLHRRHGENDAAVKWIAELVKAKGDNSVIDEAVEKTAKSIELERAYQRKALEYYEKAAAAGKVEKAAAAQMHYMLGELHRRLGDRTKAAVAYRKALDDGDVKKLAEEQLKLVE